MDIIFQAENFGEILPPGISPFVVRVSTIQGGWVYAPSINPTGIRFGVLEAGSVFGVFATKETTVNFGVFNAGEIVVPNVSQSNPTISFSSLFLGRIIAPRVSIGEVLPLKFKSPSVRGGGPVSSNDLALGVRGYVQVNQSSEYSAMSDFSYTKISGIVDDYIPSFEAVFSRDYYSGFYVVNDSNLTRENVHFWVDGGGYYRLVSDTVDKTIYEAEHLYLSEIGNLADSSEFVANQDSYIMGGSTRTSLFGSLLVSYFVYPNQVLPQVSDTGIGTGINLTTTRFTEGNQKTRLGNMAPGESVGIYLKIRPRFSIDIPVQKDYSFFHLSYKTIENNSYESVPGQVRSPASNYTSLMIPSVYLSASTNYSSLKTTILDETKAMYDKYPPYFLAYEDG